MSLSRTFVATSVLFAFGTVATPALAGKKPAYRNHVYARPAMGANVFTPEEGESVTVVSVGGVAGINYWETGRQYPKIRGNARVAADYVMGASDLSGYQVRVGNFTGPLWKTAGFTVSMDQAGYLQVRYGEDEASPELAFMTPDAGPPGIEHPPFSGTGLIVSVPTIDADDKFRGLKKAKAEIMSDPSDKPWGWRSFAAVDPNGVILDFFHVIDQTASADAQS